MSISNQTIRTLTADQQGQPHNLFRLFVDLFDHSDFMAYPGYDPAMIHSLGFKSLFSTHIPSLPDIPGIRYSGVRNVGLIAVPGDL